MEQFLSVEEILDFCEKATKTSNELYKRSLNAYSENGQPYLLNAMAYFQQQASMYGFDIPNIIKNLVAEGKAVSLDDNINGWISVEDRLPEKAGSYLVIGKSGGATVTRWYEPNKYNPKGCFGGNGAEYIRYWMPRPEPPEEYKEEQNGDKKEENI